MKWFERPQRLIRFPRELAPSDCENEEIVTRSYGDRDLEQRGSPVSGETTEIDKINDIRWGRE